MHCTACSRGLIQDEYWIRLIQDEAPAVPLVLCTTVQHTHGLRDGGGTQSAMLVRYGGRCGMVRYDMRPEAVERARHGLQDGMADGVGGMADGADGVGGWSLLGIQMELARHPRGMAEACGSQGGAGAREEAREEAGGQGGAREEAGGMSESGLVYRRPPWSWPGRASVRLGRGRPPCP
jgi:hypothetical protein